MPKVLQQHALFESLGSLGDAEQIDCLAEGPGVRIERILSRGHATPEGQWYDQPLDEWVLLVQGSARLQIEGEPSPRRLEPGDAVLLPAGCRHRVAATDPVQTTVWVAVHGRFGAPVP